MNKKIAIVMIDKVFATGYTPTYPDIIGTQQTFCLINGKSVALFGELVAEHIRQTPPRLVHSDDMIIASTITTYVNGTAVARIDDATTNTPPHIVDNSLLGFVFSD